MVDGLCAALAADGWEVVRDRDAMKPGDRISAFMNQIARADRIVVVLSAKYLRSTYCMRELYGIYQRSVGDGDEFLERVKPLTLEDARFGNWRERKDIAEYWRKEYEEMSLHIKDLGARDLELYRAMKDWHNNVGDILAHVNDVLHPHGFAGIVQDYYAGLRQMFEDKREEPVVLQPGMVKLHPKDGQPYVWIPPSADGTIREGFWIGQTPVTQEAFQQVMGTNPSHFKGPKRPVEQVTWDEALEYATKIGMRLPTEVEWEYAARAGSLDDRYGELDDIAWYDTNSGGETHDVGKKKANSWGLYDMLGNVWEWSADSYPGKKWRVLRGGSWNHGPEIVLVSYRGGDGPGDRLNITASAALGKSIDPF